MEKDQAVMVVFSDGHVIWRIIFADGSEPMDTFPLTPGRRPLIPQEMWLNLWKGGQNV